MNQLNRASFLKIYPCTAKFMWSLTLPLSEETLNAVWKQLWNTEQRSLICVYRCVIPFFMLTRSFPEQDCISNTVAHFVSSLKYNINSVLVNPKKTTYATTMKPWEPPKQFRFSTDYGCIEFDISHCGKFKCNAT